MAMVGVGEMQSGENDFEVLIDPIRRPATKPLRHDTRPVQYHALYPNRQSASIIRLDQL
jgi:hypothetical protein